jgi:hypothetical protein
MKASGEGPERGERGEAVEHRVLELGGAHGEFVGGGVAENTSSMAEFRRSCSILSLEWLLNMQNLPGLLALLVAMVLGCAASLPSLPENGEGQEGRDEILSWLGSAIPLVRTDEEHAKDWRLVQRTATSGVVHRM